MRKKNIKKQDAEEILLHQDFPDLEEQVIKPHPDAIMDAHDSNQGKMLDSSELGNTLLG